MLSKTVNDQDVVESDTRILSVSIGLKTLSGLVMSYFLHYEIKSAMRQEGYFSEVWNLIDMLLFALLIPTYILDILNLQFILVTVLQVLVISLAFLKICFFLRIYDDFSFLVSMMAGVFADIKYFFAFWILFLGWFTLIFTILF